MVVAAVAGLAACGCGGGPERRPPEAAGSAGAVWPSADALPEAAPGGWQAAGPAREYTPETLFEHIDGGADFYLRYGFRRGLVREYEGEVGTAVVELYEMASTADAYGAFHWELPTDRPALGAAATWEGGVVKVWVDRYLVRVSAEREEEGTRAAVLGLAREVVAGLPAGGEEPELVRRAQAAGMEENSLRYFRHVETLNSIGFREAWSQLGLTSDTEAVWGELADGGEVLVVRYGTEESASAAGESVREALTEEGAAGCAVAAEGRELVVVLGADSQAEVERLVAAF
jgi:hypothetical protein